MKKNIQNKLGELKKNLVALLSSNKLKAAILAPMALALAACDNGAGGTDNPYVSPYEEETPNPPDTEDPTKEVSSRDLKSLSATYNGTSAKSLDNILNNTTFNINYDITYTDNTVDNKTATVDKSRLEEFFNGVVSFSFSGDFSETNQTVDLIITYNGKTITISGIKNGNYKSQEGQQPSIKDVTALLKEILTEKEYNRISGELSSGNITLTAQTIKAVGDAFSVLENDAKNGSAQASTEKTVKDNKDAFVAQAQNAITVSQSGGKYTITYNKNFNFNGTFNLDEISFEKINNAEGNFSNATLTNGGSKILIDKLNDIRGSSLPTLLFEKTNNITDDSSEKDTYNLYKAYSKELGKLKLKGDLNTLIIDGKELSDNSNYTLFETDGNTAKSAGDGTIKSLNIDALVQMTKQLNIYSFYNMIISGDATENYTVNWKLRNIVFEGDMSKIKNNCENPTGVGSLFLYGIIYFKNKPYNNNGSFDQNVEGMLKLDNLTGVSSENFKVNFSSNPYSVLDVRGASLDNYNLENKNQILEGGAHAIYFNDKYKPYEKNKIQKLCYKFSNPNVTAIDNVYLGDNKVSYKDVNDIYSNRILFSAASRQPRTLKEFEDFGNSYDRGSQNYKQFKKSAKSSYEGYTEDWNNLEQRERDSFTADESDKMLAKNDRRIEFIDPETEKIIFSVVNDRQYNA